MKKSSLFTHILLTCKFDEDRGSEENRPTTRWMAADHARCHGYEEALWRTNMAGQHRVATGFISHARALSCLKAQGSMAVTIAGSCQLKL